jgi:hypothetical protein
MSPPVVHDLQGFEKDVLALIERHELGQRGRYRRWTQQDADGARDLGLNPYGCADAANLLYTLGRFPRDATTRQRFVETLRGLQSTDDGLFYEATHHPIHTTAHCLGALELFDAGPIHRLAGLDAWREPEAMEAMLESLKWSTNPWGESHKGAGLFAAMHLAGESTPEWEDRYFVWLERATDPATGMPRGETLGEGRNLDLFLFPALAGTFHYLFNQQHIRRPLPHAEALVDICLDIRERRLFPFFQRVGFAEIDWIYCLNRAVRQCGHRFDEARAATRDFGTELVEFLTGLAPESHPGLDDLHDLFGAVCAIAELQQALPGEYRTARPWHLVLDRRPFI